ncbi:MAG: RnfABCDGE type electron transport complex subunit D [Bacillota bacterium]|nr:RnfABCDGE type electron transport complex subunit D [Bacillota bacterium]
MEKLLTVTSSPHIRSEENTHSIMTDVIIALMPPLVAAMYFFGYRALLHTLVGVVSCILFEYITRRIMKRNNTIGDLSAVVTGILLAYNMSVSAPLWMTVIGSFIAIVVAKQLFGGLGQNFMNPALTGRIFLAASFTGAMTTWAHPVFLWTANLGADAVTTATPLVSLKAHTLPDTSLFMMLLGGTGGCIGETSALLLVAGGIYLMMRRVITWHTPVSYIGTVAIITFLSSGGLNRGQFMLSELLSGGLMLGAFFMATDYATTPVTGKGRIIFGIGCGLLTVLIRYYGGYPEGVSYAIVLMNLLTWFIDKYTKPKAFGRGVKLG